MEMTYHCAVKRYERVQAIINQIGIGQIVKEKFIHDKYICVTDTGITIIKDVNKVRIITMYVTTYHELITIYNGTKKIPPYLKKKVDRNQSLYTKNGKTIWA